MNLGEIACEDVTGLGLCPAANFILAVSPVREFDSLIVIYVTLQ
jgi:hypothetical protein